MTALPVVVRNVVRYRIHLWLAIPLVLYILRAHPSKHSSTFTLSPCSDAFHITIQNMPSTHFAKSEWPCIVKAPPNYESPYKPSQALWSIPRANVGKLNTSDELYTLHVNRQRWARITPDRIILREEGGTSGRAFANNFAYVKLVLQHALLLKCRRGGRKAVMLDMGAGIGSVAAAMKDERGGNDSVHVIGYVWPDNYLRLQTIMSHRLLDSFVWNFSGKVPFPRESLDIVHCKWCWHHLVGYDVWLEEVDRVLRPGGWFVFTLEKEGGMILEKEEWEEALKRRTRFECKRVKGIVLMCRKSGGEEGCDGVKRVGRGGEGVRKLNKVLEGREGTFERRLGIEYIDGWQKLGRDVVHVGGEGLLKQVLDAGLVGWIKPAGLLNVYPRSFDVVHVQCGRWGTEEDWVDIHRILRPGGVVVKLGCNEQSQRQSTLHSGFAWEQVRGDLTLGWRRGSSMT